MGRLTPDARHHGRYGPQRQFGWGFAGDDTTRAVFLMVVFKPKMLGILVGMDQKDRYVARLLFACPLCATTGTVGYTLGKVVDFPVVPQRPFFHGPDCVADHTDSPFARGEGG